MSKNFVEGLPILEPIKDISTGEIIYQSLLSHTEKHPALNLEKKGIRGIPFKPIKSYLSNRKQVYVLDINAVLTGEPQGTIQGPILFIVYNDDLPDILQKVANNRQELTLEEYNIPDVWRRTLDNFPVLTPKELNDDTSVINASTGESLTYAELLSRTCSLAEALRNCRYGPNTTILVSSNNHLQFYVPVISSLYIGATVTTMNPSYTHSELYHVMNISKPSIVFCSEENVRKYTEIKDQMKFIERIIVIDSPVSTMEADCLDDFIWRNTRASVSRISTTTVNTKEHVAFILYSSGTTGLPKGVMLTHRNINATFLILQLHVEELRQGYGLTESTLVVTINGIGTYSSNPGSSGKVVPYTQMGVRDLETERFVGPNEIGEICIKGESVMKGYCGNLEATKNTFTEDGWLLTGDVGYYDEDGDFFITDRLKELIKYKGFQVAPAELEALLLTHPEIIDSGVVGVADEKAGEVPLAFVVKSEKTNLTERNVQEFVKGKLSPQKWLRGGVIFVENIPKNPTGKVLRRKLQQMAKQYQSKL